MKQGCQELEFYYEGLPLVSSLYACSKAFCRINVKPICKPSDISHTFLPNMAYFEFLSVKNEHDESIEMKSNDEYTKLVDLVNDADWSGGSRRMIEFKLFNSRIKDLDMI
ncbi:hypothetical protein J1N35_007237 [Gossypium stocksii]|uniref:Uncharacterized protein n=1 Tax=Gossypium stocksii TaxID=47602 RepID=A0A9D3W5N9_9ROSI|nr:hypothetical protein J1N35_007237 [Gossypium stocksii]